MIFGTPLLDLFIITFLKCFNEVRSFIGFLNNINYRFKDIESTKKFNLFKQTYTERKNMIER